jgi:3,4-dihydroxy 2-butanone 4-phosphate synthase/GTP cyclohydrolase II
MAIISSTYLITEFGEFKVSYHKIHEDFCVSLSVGKINLPNPIVRVHSSCLFSESLHSVDCDCDLQLTKAMELIGKKKNGVIIYLYQEGRGLGLANKIKAMEVERTRGVDTVEAFTELHFDLDPRDYTIAIQALNELGVNKHIRLISNNPRKREQLEKGGFVVSNKVTQMYPINKRVREYLKVKQNKLGHSISEKLLQS